MQCWDRHGLKTTSCRFLQYGYAEEFEKCQSKAASDKAYLVQEAALRHAALEAAAAKIAQARAEAIQTTSDRFLQYGYAEEFEKCQGKAASDKAYLVQEAALRHAALEAANAKIAQARAEAIQTTSDRSLQYGYAEEFQKFQSNALGDKAPPAVE